MCGLYSQGGLYAEVVFNTGLTVLKLSIDLENRLSSNLIQYEKYHCLGNEGFLDGLGNVGLLDGLGNVGLYRRNVTMFQSG